MVVEKHISRVYIETCKDYDNKFSTYKHHIIYNIDNFLKKKKREI